MGRPKSPKSGAELPIGKPFQQGNEQRQIARKGGIASAQKRAKLKTLKEQLEMLLSCVSDDGISEQTSISVALIAEAKKGNTKAYQIIRDTIGQKPTDNVSVNLPDSGIMDEIRKRMEGVQK